MQPHLTLRTRFALSVYLLPFLIGGILLGTRVAGWFYASLTGTSRAWFFLLAIGFAAVGILFGTLLAYGILIFFITWLAPNSELLSVEELEKPAVAQRLFAPAFLMVRRLAQRVAPGTHK
jgi:hypothetical protein